MVKELKEVIDIFEHAMFHLYLAIVFGPIAMVKDGRTGLAFTACVLSHLILVVKYKKEKKLLSNEELSALLLEENKIRIRTCRNVCLSFILVAIISLLLNKFYDVKIIYTKVAVVAALIFFLMLICLKLKKQK